MDDIFFRELVAKAVMAPSGHNTQPWRFSLRSDGMIVVAPDFSVQLPSVDPYNRELFISVGCAIENIAIYADSLGYATAVVVDDVNCLVRLEKLSTPLPSDLADAIESRQTNRSAYNGNIVPEHVIDELAACGAKLYANGTPEYTLIGDFVELGNKIQMSNPCYKDELKKWLRFNKHHAEECRDGLSYDSFGAPNMPRVLTEAIMKLMLNSTMQNRSDRKRIESSSHFAVFQSKNTIESWVRLGMKLQRFLLTAESHGVACAYMNQPCEVKGLAEAMKDALELDKFPQIIVRIGYADRASHSLRRATGSFIDEI